MTVDELLALDALARRRQAARARQAVAAAGLEGALEAGFLAKTSPAGPPGPTMAPAHLAPPRRLELDGFRCRPSPTGGAPAHELEAHGIPRD